MIINIDFKLTLGSSSTQQIAGWVWTVVPPTVIFKVVLKATDLALLII